MHANVQQKTINSAALASVATHGGTASCIVMEMTCTSSSVQSCEQGRYVNEFYLAVSHALGALAADHVASAGFSWQQHTTIMS